MLQHLRQHEMFEVHREVADRNPKQTSRSGAFTDNMRLPVHRWFRYSAGFSGEWAEEIIAGKQFGKDEIVFDPFAGSATTLLAAQRRHISSVGVEHHHFVFRVAEAKLLWTENEQGLLDVASNLLKQANLLLPTIAAPDSILLARCYSIEAAKKLEALKYALLDIEASEGVHKLLWLAITAVLRECSGVGTAQWQYLLPNKTKARIADPFLAFHLKTTVFAADMASTKSLVGKPCQTKILFGDARDMTLAPELTAKARLILTSPPYPNNYDYADATRLEMTFWGEIKRWADLQEAIRFRLVRSCSQHSAAEKLVLKDLLNEPAIAPIREELSDVCDRLAAEREIKAGKKTYHTMIAAYFIDLANVWISLREKCADGGDACFMIGDSAPYGVHVPVDRWLGDLALAAGFKSHTFKKLRDRNVKWKNRKHQVPLKEGVLLVNG